MVINVISSEMITKKDLGESLMQGAALMEALHTIASMSGNFDEVSVNKEIYGSSDDGNLTIIYSLSGIISQAKREESA